MVAFDWTEKEELQNLEFLVIRMLEVCKINDLSTAAATDCCMADGVSEGLGSENCSGHYVSVYCWVWKRQPGFKSQLHLFLAV